MKNRMMMGTFILILIIVLTFSLIIIIKNKSNDSIPSNPSYNDYSSSWAISYCLEYLSHHYDVKEIYIKELHASNTTNGISRYWDCLFYVMLDEDGKNEIYEFRMMTTYLYLNHSFSDDEFWSVIDEYYISLTKINASISIFNEKLIYINSTCSIPKMYEYYNVNILPEIKGEIYWNGIYFYNGIWEMIFRGTNTMNEFEIIITCDIRNSNISHDIYYG